MSTKNEPVDPRIRLAISVWPDDAPRGTVTSFCAEYGISRKTFYAIRARAKTEGQAAALEPRSRRPKTNPSKVSEEIERQALAVRSALEASGLDFGPISVHDKMKSLGLSAPGIATLARLFRRTGVARREPRKKPRSAYRRFVYPAPNACWQLDATEYVLRSGRKCVIFQLEDDHSRLAIASHVASGETSAGALAVMKKGIAKHGVPQKLLSDNGAALNPWRRGSVSALVKYARSLGVEAITGKPQKPTTQGKNERFHQTLFRWLEKQPFPATMDELQEQIDRFDVIYNTERPNQGLPNRTTPQQAWDATPLADAPLPPSGPSIVMVPGPTTDGSTSPLTRISEIHVGVAGHREATVRKNGTVQLRNIRWQISSRLAGQKIHITWDAASVIFTDQRGEVIAEHPWPPEGTVYVSNGLPSGRRRLPRPSPMS